MAPDGRGHTVYGIAELSPYHTIQSFPAGAEPCKPSETRIAGESLSATGLCFIGSQYQIQIILLICKLIQALSYSIKVDGAQGRQDATRYDTRHFMRMHVSNSCHIGRMRSTDYPWGWMIGIEGI